MALLDCIKDDLIRQKDRFIQMRENSLVEQKNIAEQQFVSPKHQELEAQKQEQLQKELELYNTKISTINAQFESSKEVFRTQLYKQVEEKVNQSFDNVIESIDNQLKDGQ